MPFPILAAAGLVGGLIKGIFGGKQKKEGKRLMANNPYPEYNIPEEQFQNQAMAKQLAASGMPTTQYAQGQQNIQRNTTTALNAAQTRRGGIGLIGNIQQRANDAQLGLDVQNASMRRQNQQNLMNVNNTVSQYRDKGFDWNKKNKYQETRAYAMGLMGAGNQNIAGGIDTALGGITSQWGGGMYGGGGGGLFGKRGGGSGMPSYYNGYGAGANNYAQYQTGY